MAEGELRLPVVPAGIEARFERNGGLFTVHGTDKAVSLTLPADAARPFVLSSRGARISVRALDAKPVPGRVEGNSVVFPGAFASGTWMHLPLEQGVEELVELERPAPDSAGHALRYELTLEKIGGLRLVESRVLEALAPDGNPLFHAGAPLVIDAAGHVREGTWSVEGCAVDTSAAMPWGRPVTPPGAAKCVVVGRFDETGLTYPLLVDPAWTTTASMATARHSHRASSVQLTSGTVCNPGCVFVTGGKGAAGYLASAEVFNESTSTWSVIASFPTARAFHASGSYIGTTGAGKVVIAGGEISTTTPWATASAYVWTTGGSAWASAGTLPGGARSDSAFAHIDGGTSATNGSFYVIGGHAGTAYSAKVDRFGDLRLSATPTWSAVTDLPGPISNASAAGAYASGTSSYNRLVVAGGRSNASTPLNTVWMSNNAVSGTIAWTSVGTLSVARYDAATVKVGSLFGGLQLLIAGGSPPTNSIDRYTFSSNALVKAPGVLGSARTAPAGAAFGTLAQQAVIVGGNPAFRTVDLMNPNADVVGTTIRVGGFGRANTTATGLSNSTVLVAGGWDLAATHSSAEIFLPQATGTACLGGADCTSLYCTDGYCCGSACGQQCQACNLPGRLGTCTTVSATNGPTGYPAGQAVTGFGTTRPTCASFGSACGKLCDGTTAMTCSNPPDTTVCVAASCSGGIETRQATCLAGSCSAPVTNPCEPYACGATACRPDCSDNSHCAPGYKCSGTICVTAGLAGATCTMGSDCMAGLSCVDSTCCTASSCSGGQRCDVAGAKGTCKLPYGAACTSSTAAQCATGNCVDGVCCDNACNRQCEACNVPGKVGYCNPVTGAPRAPRSACVGTGACAAACDGSDPTKCGTPPATTTVCAAQGCTGTTYTPTRYCDGVGACVAVSSTNCGAYQCDVGGTCKVGCTGTGDCAAGYFCTGGLCKTTGAIGTACTDGSECGSGKCTDGVCCTVDSCTAPTVCNANATGTCSLPIAATCTTGSQCGSGFCADGLCCNKACTGNCEACDVPGSAGTCTAVLGAPRGARPACGGTGLCRSTCDGTDTTKCNAWPGASSTCSAASCTAGVATLASYCDGAGNCGTAVTKACAPYICDATDCKTTCTAEADCASGYRCFENKCVPKAGIPCTSSADCASGFCVDGVCCDGACTGQCEACDVAGNEGKCAGITGAPHGSRTACFAGGGDPCKALSCDGGKDRVKCTSFSAAFETTCGPATCSAGELVEAPRCDGMGSCKASTTKKSCSPYACGDGACKTTCATATDCASGFTCTGGACTPEATATCTPDGLSSQPKDGAAKPCGAFRCDPSTGNCYDKCTASEQCGPGFVCGDGTCVAAPAAGGATGDDGGGCVLSHRASRGGLAAWALAALALGVLRRRGARARR